jgi:hypothetical protein
VRVLSAKSYEFSYLQSIAISGQDAFVTNNASVTEFNTSTGALVRILSAKNYAFNEPDAITISGPNAFVANVVGNSVTEFNLATGALVRVLR